MLSDQIDMGELYIMCIKSSRMPMGYIAVRGWEEVEESIV